MRDEGLSFNLSKLASLYNLVSHGSHKFLFKAKPQHPLPLLKTTKNDTNSCVAFHFKLSFHEYKVITTKIPCTVR
ncbi:hypothetical protein Hanom_Chr08g00742051 [Helianthus anomalus]